MELGKKVKLNANGHQLCLAELAVGGREIDPIVEIGSRTLGSLHHIILFPEPEGAFNQGFSERTNCKAQSYLNFLWWYSTHQNRLMHTITKEFVLATKKPSELSWNVTIIPWLGGEAISIVFGYTRAMEKVYDLKLRSPQPQPKH